jgi:hypothetical protein
VGLPAAGGGHAGLVFGRQRDTGYTFGRPEPADGQLVILRADGRLELRQIPADNGHSAEIGGTDGDAVVVGRWESLEVAVDTAGVTLRRTTPGVTSAVVRGPTPPSGGYFALTRNFPGTEAAVRFRNVRVSAG